MLSIKIFLHEKDIDNIIMIATRRFNKYKKRYVLSKVYFMLYLIFARFVSVWAIFGNGFAESIPLIVMFLLGLYVYVLLELEYKKTKILNFISKDFIVMEYDKEYIVEFDKDTVTINREQIFNIKDFSVAIVFEGAIALTDGRIRTIVLNCDSEKISQIAKILKNNRISVFKLNKYR